MLFLVLTVRRCSNVMYSNIKVVFWVNMEEAVAFSYKLFTTIMKKKTRLQIAHLISHNILPSVGWWGERGISDVNKVNNKFFLSLHSMKQLRRGRERTLPESVLTPNTLPLTTYIDSEISWVAQQREREREPRHFRHTAVTGSLSISHTSQCDSLTRQLRHLLYCSWRGTKLSPALPSFIYTIPRTQSAGEILFTHSEPQSVHYTFCSFLESLNS